MSTCAEINKVRIKSEFTHCEVDTVSFKILNHKSFVLRYFANICLVFYSKSIPNVAEIQFLHVHYETVFFFKFSSADHTKILEKSYYHILIIGSYANNTPFFTYLNISLSKNYYRFRGLVY